MCIHTVLPVSLNFVLYSNRFISTSGSKSSTCFTTWRWVQCIKRHWSFNILHDNHLHLYIYNPMHNCWNNHDIWAINHGDQENNPHKWNLGLNPPPPSQCCKEIVYYSPNTFSFHSQHFFRGEGAVNLV